MAECAVCQQDYDKCMEIDYGGEHYAFCCFECAIHKLAPMCAHCGCRIIGHGKEDVGAMYCCAHCATAGAVVKAHHRH